MIRLRKIFKRFYRVIIALILLLFIFFVALYFAIQSSEFQNYISKKVTNSLSEKFNAEISIGNIEVEFFNNLLLEDFFIEDLNKDTLVYFKKAKADFSYFSLLDKSVNLEDVIISNLKLNLNRNSTDTTFNFNFLLPKKNSKVKDKEIWDLSLKNFKLVNTNFFYDDSLKGNILNSKIPELNIFVNEFDLEKKKIDLKELIISNPTINFTKISSIKKSNKEFKLDIPTFIYAQKLNIKNANVIFKNHTDSVEYYNMAFNDLQLKTDIIITNTYLWKDSISAKIQQIKIEEKSGFKIKNLSAIISVNGNKMILDTLSLNTNSSFVNTSAKMTYRSFDDFKDFSNRVRFKAYFSNTTINPDDLKYFVNTSKLGIGGVFKIKGELKGKLRSLKAKNIELFAGNRTHFKGKFSMNGLPNIQETFISFRMDRLVTDYEDLIYIYNKIPLPDNSSKLGKIIFKGKFDGFYSDFVSEGEAFTDLGYIKTDVNFKISEHGTPSYSGVFRVENFEIGQWFNKEQIGAVTLSGKIFGKGFNLKNLDATIDSEIEKITFRDYTYQNLKIDGSLKDNFFKGNAIINDEHLKMNFKGLVDISASTPIFDFTANLEKLDLLPLNLSKKDYIISAELKSNFKANNIDDVLGELEMKNLKVDYKFKSYKLKNLYLNSEIHDGEKHFDIIADNIKILIHGTYQVSKLPLALKHIFIPNDSISINPQKLRFDAEITDKTDLISLFVPKLKIPKKIIVSGNLDTETQSILTFVEIPKLHYGNITTKDFISNIVIKNGEIDMINSLPAIYLNDSLIVKDISLLAKGLKENITYSLNASNVKENNLLAVNGNLKYINKLFTLNLNENSKILVNNAFWNIAKDNSISFNKNILKAQNFKITNKDSEANLNVNRDFDANNLVINLKNIHINDFTQILKNKGTELKGTLSGEIKLDNIDDELAINGDLNLLDIIVNDYKIGNFRISSNVDLKAKKVLLKGGLFSKENHIDINGSYSFSKESKRDDIDINILIKQFTVKSFEDFIPQFINHSSGTLKGNLKIYGHRKVPNLNGFVDINDVTTTVTYTQTKYTIADTRVMFEDDVLQLEDSLLLQDEEGNVAYGSGKVTHENFKNWALDLRVVTDKIKALNTTKADNETFYGTAYLNGGAAFTGLIFEPLVYIWGESEEKSFIDVPLTDDVQHTQHKFYKFITKKDKEKVIVKKEVEEVIDEAIKIRGSRVKLDLNLDEDLELKLILDQDAGDILRVKGIGNIKIDVGQSAEYVNFFGTYDVTYGDYLFTMQNIVNKPFRIASGSSIRFNGDIYEDATIDMSATYTRKVALDNFIIEYLSDSDEELKSIAKTRVPVTLFLDLSEKLSKPTIKFDIGIDRIDPKIRNFVESKLQAIKINESEMNNQIFGVLVLTRFIPSYSALESSILTSSDAAINTVTELLSIQMSRYLTDWASLLVKDLEFMVNFSSYDPNYLSEETLKKRRELQLALSKRFLKDRLSINVGGNFDFGETNSLDGNTSTNSTFFGGNVSFEYTLTENRRWRVKAFTDSDYDNYNIDNRQTRTGVGLSYRREFDDIYDLFNFKKKKAILSRKK